MDWRRIKDDPPPHDEEILAANEDYAGGNQKVVEWDDDREGEYKWCADGHWCHVDAFTHWKPLGPGPGDK